MKKNPTSVWIRTAPIWLTALSVVLTALVAEGILRLFPQLMPEEAQLRALWRGQREDLLAVGHPYLGVLYKPLQQKRMYNRDFDIVVATDEKGFRNRGPWPAQADIVAVGDSLVFGFGVDFPLAWTSLLEARLGNARVVNLGMPGSGPWQYTRYLEVFGVPLHPKVILYGLYPVNDLSDVDAFDHWIDAGSPGNYDEFRLFSGGAVGAMDRLLQQSYLALALRVARRNLHYNSEFKPQTIPLNGGRRVLVVPALDARARANMNPANPIFVRMSEAIARARQLADSVGARMICLIFPSKSRVYLPAQGKDYRGPSDPLIAYLQQQGYEVLDLANVLEAHAARGEMVYFETDGHPNELGNRIIAERIDEYLQTPARPATGT